MKPFQLIILAGFGLLALIGLIVFAGANQTSRSGGVGSVAMWGTLPQEEIDAVLRDIRDIREDFDGITYSEVPPSRFYNTYIEALAADRGPDLVLIPHEQLVAIQETIQPLSFESFSLRNFQDTYIDGADIALLEGGYYGMPIGIDPLIMFYNRSILNAARISEPPQYWEQFIGLVPSVVEKTGSFGLERSFVAFGAYQNVEHAAKIISNLFFQVGTPIVDENQRPVFANKGNAQVAVAESALRFFTSFANPNTSAYSWSSGLRNDQEVFIRGDLALYFAPASESQELEGLSPAFTIGTAPFPQLEGGNPVVYGSVYMLVVPRASKNNTGAQRVAFTFANTPTLVDLFSQATDIAPLHRTLLAQAPQDPIRALAYDAAFLAKGWLSPQPTLLNQAFSAMVEDVVSGRRDADDALTEAARKLR